VNANDVNACIDRRYDGQEPPRGDHACRSSSSDVLVDYVLYHGETPSRNPPSRVTSHESLNVER